LPFCCRELVGQLGIVAEKIDITPMVEGFIAAAGKVDAHRLGNVMARARMIALYDRSAEHRALVIGTSNKTELLLGYGTLHGDLASALNPICAPIRPTRAILACPMRKPIECSRCASTRG
jgi:NAD+ synthase